jgi:RNA polymerase sigma-70 factor (ECF subfamily)
MDASPFSCVASARNSHEGELRGYLRHRLDDPHAAADLLQDVFVKALRQGQGFCTLHNPRAWLFQVARNALVDRVRMQHPQESLTPELADSLPHESEPEAPVDALSDCLSRMLAELAPFDADILRACDLEGETQRSFAHRQGLGLPATKSRLLRARQRLRDRLVQACRVDLDATGRVAGHVPRGEPPSGRVRA